MLPALPTDALPLRLRNKIFLDATEALTFCQDRKQAGQTLVFTNGCFDLLHVGHVLSLEAAAKFGPLVLGLNSDASVRRLKGESRPMNPWMARAAVLAALEAVAAVVLFDDDTPRELIRLLQPDVLVKGNDYRPDQVAGAELLPAWGGRLELIPLVQGYSSTRLMQGGH